MSRRLLDGVNSGIAVTTAEANMTENEGQPMSESERNILDWARVLAYGLKTLRQESPGDVPSDAEVYKQVTESNVT
jgi:hypothetical protein